MNIFILNNSGNTGKTTLTKHAFMPQMGPNATRVSIESINTGDGESDQEITAKQFKTLAGQLNLADADEHFVVDCGASNIEKVLLSMADLATTRNSVDFWVIPAVPQKKQVADSVATVRSLLEIGIPAEKILIVFNNIVDVDTVKQDFSSLYVFEKLGVHIASEGVLASDIYEATKGSSETVFDIANQKLDLKAMKKAALASDNPAEAFEQLAELSVLFDMAVMSKKNLVAFFESTPIYEALELINSTSVQE